MAGKRRTTTRLQSLVKTPAAQARDRAAKLVTDRKRAVDARKSLRAAQVNARKEEKKVAALFAREIAKVKAEDRRLSEFAKREVANFKADKKKAVAKRKARKASVKKFNANRNPPRAF